MMARMVGLKRPKSDDAGAPETMASPANDGVAIHLEHHHLMKMKDADGEPIAGRLKSGHKVEFHGTGTVERSETQSTPEGDRHSATIRLHKGAVEHEASPDEERDELRDEIARNTAAAEAKG
jgi:hypothetical protein